MTLARRFALLGDPVAHSKSPLIQNAAFQALGLPHTYEAIRVSENDLASYIAQLRDGIFSGFNITIPHKQAILKHVDERDRSTSLAGAANTIFFRNGKVHAANTDLAALAAEIAPRLESESFSLENRDRVGLVIGTGGAARAAVVALSEHLHFTHIFVRGRNGNAEKLAKELESKSPRALSIVGQPLVPSAHDSEFDCVIQTTSAGMSGGDSGEEVADCVAWDQLDAKHVVAIDVVYSPPETPFLKRARERHIQHANGLGMLARQGALAFETWLEIPAPLDVMLASLTRS